MATAALRADGIDCAGRRPKSIDAVKDQPCDLIITACDRACSAPRCTGGTGAADRGWSFHAAEGLEL